MTEQPSPSQPGPEDLADQREREADELEQQSEELRSSLSDARDDWARKRSDEGVPGAPAPDDESGSEPGASAEATDRDGRNSQSDRGAADNPD